MAEYDYEIWAEGKADDDLPRKIAVRDTWAGVVRFLAGLKGISKLDYLAVYREPRKKRG